MTRKFILTLLIAIAINIIGSAQTPTNSIIIDAASFRPVQSDALTGIAIDPIGLDGSNRPCTRLKMRINRMTRKEIGELSLRLRGGVIDLRKCDVAYEGNGLIIEMTAHANTRLYLHHERFGSSNEVQISTEGNKEYYIEASLNQLYPITVASNTADAEVYIDDVFMGYTNADCSLLVEEILSGTHRLKMIYGNERKEATIEVNPRSVYFRQDFITIRKVEAMPKSTEFCEMVFVKGGTFTMGATPEQGNDAESDEKPAHSVTVSDFYISKYEVTQAQWVSIMGSNPSYYKGDSYKLPVECVSNDDIQKFLQKLNEKTGKKYRLPTEAEWEYAARGGNRSRNYKYSGSNKIDEVGWHAGNSNDETHPVGSKQPNELGIYDMTGNVDEWCSDRQQSYLAKTNTDPSQAWRYTPILFLGYNIRGGSYCSETKECRNSHRRSALRHLSFIATGFRLVLEQ